MSIELQPMDVVVFDGTGKFLHNVIEWRCLDTAVHCTTIRASDGSQFDPDFKGLKISSINDYKGRYLSIHRYRGYLDRAKLIRWCDNLLKPENNTGYDYKQWLFGFVFGITAKSISDNETSWTCAELPYWAFQENGYKLTEKDEVLPMPRLFRYNMLFEKIFEGTW